MASGGVTKIKSFDLNLMIDCCSTSSPQNIRTVSLKNPMEGGAYRRILISLDFPLIVVFKAIACLDIELAS